MSINNTNYEIFFLDYYEGTLSTAQVEELMAFLEKEPDLKVEFDDFELVRLQDADEVLFEAKASLKRGEITADNYERYFAAFVEGDLNPEERLAVENFAYSSPSLQRELELMQKTRLHTDYSIVFPDKKELKRGRIIPLYAQVLRYGAVAAVVLFFATLFFVQVPRFNEPQLVDLPPTPVETPITPAPVVTPGPELAEAVVSTPSVTEEVKHEVSRRTPSRSSSVAIAKSAPVSVPQPLQTSRLMARGATPVEASLAEGTNMEQRSEFEYWHLREKEEVTPPVTPSSPGDLIQLAYDGLQRNMPDNVRQMEERLSTDRRGALREIASVSIIGINNLLGNPLNVERQLDANGKTKQLAIGDSFEVTRE